MNKLCNNALHFLRNLIFYNYIIYKLCSIKYNLDVLLNLTMATLTSIFVCKAYQIR